MIIIYNGVFCLSMIFLSWVLWCLLD